MGLFHFHLQSNCFSVRSGGGIGEIMKPIFWETTTESNTLIFSRIVYSLSFFFVIIVILLNIIFGIIIDTFGELREKQEVRNKEMNDKCFICTLGTFFNAIFS